MKPKHNVIQYTVEEQKEYLATSKKNQKIADDYFGTPTDHSPF